MAAFCPLDDVAIVIFFDQRVSGKSPDNQKKPLAPVAQGIEHSFPKAGVGGSNPLGGALISHVL